VVCVAGTGLSASSAKDSDDVTLISAKRKNTESAQPQPTGGVGSADEGPPSKRTKLDAVTEPRTAAELKSAFLSL
jgi:hypothetical protein